MTQTVSPVTALTLLLFQAFLLLLSNSGLTKGNKNCDGYENIMMTV